MKMKWLKKDNQMIKRITNLKKDNQKDNRIFNEFISKYRQIIGIFYVWLSFWLSGYPFLSKKYLFRKKNKIIFFGYEKF